MDRLTICNFIIIVLLSIELLTPMCYGVNISLSMSREIDAEATLEGADELFSQEGDGDEASSQDLVDSSVSEDEESVSIEEAIRESSEEEAEVVNEASIDDTPVLEDEVPVPIEEAGSTALGAGNLASKSFQGELPEGAIGEAIEPSAIDTLEMENEVSTQIGGASTLASKTLQDGPGEVMEETLGQGQLDPLGLSNEASGPVRGAAPPVVIASDPAANVIQGSVNGIHDAPTPLTDAVQPVVAADNSEFSTDGFEKVSNDNQENADVTVSPSVGLDTKFAKLGSKLSFPFVILFDKVARAKVLLKEFSLSLKTGLKQKILEPKLVFFTSLVKAASEVVSASSEFIASSLNANQAVPEVDADPMEKSNVVLSGNIPRPVDVEEEMEEVVEGETVDQDQLQPIIDSLQPLTVATQDLSDALQPIVDAVNVEEPETFREISEDVAGILGQVAQVTAPVIGFQSRLAAPVVKLGAEAFAPVVKIGAKIAKKKDDILFVPIEKLTNKVAAAGRSAKEFFAKSEFDKGFGARFRLKKVPDGPLNFRLFAGGKLKVDGLEEVSVKEVDGDVVEEEPIQAPFFVRLENGDLVPQSIDGEGTIPVVVDDSFEDIVADHNSATEPGARGRRSVNKANQHGDSAGKGPELLLTRRRSSYAHSFTNYGDESGEVVTYFEDTPYRAHPQSRRKPYRSRPERPLVEKVSAEVGGEVPENVEEVDEVQEELEAPEDRMSTATREEIEFSYDVGEGDAPVETPLPRCMSELTYMTTSMCHRIEEYSISKCDRACGSSDEDVEALIDLCKEPSNERMCKFMVKTSKMDGDGEPCEVYAFKFFRLLDDSSYCRSQIKCAVESHLCQKWELH